MYESKFTAMKMPIIHIGTSGWHYKHWVGEFYPEKTKSEDMLRLYLETFKTVELNNSFYRLPEQKTFESWAGSVPDHFIFALKASRYITHIKKLKDGRQSFERLQERIEILKNKLGPILFQLPPGWNYNGERLNDFLEVLPNNYQYAFEFRNHSWYNDEAYGLLGKKNAAFVIYELEGHKSPLQLTSDFAYLRLHGPAGKYQGSYDDETLRKWLKKFGDWTENGIKEVYCYFDNDQKGYAAFNAKRMLELL
jgi:uncharacterized protein YecE (DUF72 family)